MLPGAGPSADVCSFALPAEQGQEFDGLGAGGAEPVRYPGVELGRLAWQEHQVLLAEHEAQPPVEDVGPLVALVYLRLGLLLALAGREHVLVGLHAAGPPAHGSELPEREEPSCLNSSTRRSGTSATGPRPRCGAVIPTVTSSPRPPAWPLARRWTSAAARAPTPSGWLSTAGPSPPPTYPPSRWSAPPRTPRRQALRPRSASAGCTPTSRPGSPPRPATTWSPPSTCTCPRRAGTCCSAVSRPRSSRAAPCSSSATTRRICRPRCRGRTCPSCFSPAMTSLPYSTRASGTSSPMPPRPGPPLTRTGTPSPFTTRCCGPGIANSGVLALPAIGQCSREHGVEPGQQVVQRRGDATSASSRPAAASQAGRLTPVGPSTCTSGSVRAR